MLVDKDSLIANAVKDLLELMPYCVLVPGEIE
jgi:hypothetical protein